MITTPERFERLLFTHLGKNHPAFNVQLRHLEKLLNRSRLAQKGPYKNAYQRIRKMIGPNYNRRVARGRNIAAQNAATTIQRHWRGTSVRRPILASYAFIASRPKNLLVKTPNNSYMYAIRRTPVAIRLHRNKVRRNRLARWA